MLQPAFAWLKVIGYLLVCAVTFYFYYFLQTKFVDWFVTTTLTRQLTAFFILGSLGWMIGRGISHSLYRVGRIMELKILLIEWMLWCSWLAEMLGAFALL